MSRIATVTIVALFALSGALHFAQRQGFISVTENVAEMTNIMLFLLCGVVFLILHFIRSNKSDWFLGPIGAAFILITVESLDRVLNLGVMMTASISLAVLVDMLAKRIRLIRLREGPHDSSEQGVQEPADDGRSGDV